MFYDKRSEVEELPPLTWRSWLVLALFIVATFFVIHPVSFKVPLPRLTILGSLMRRKSRIQQTPVATTISENCSVSSARNRRWCYMRVSMDMKLAPWLAILILLASTAIVFTHEVVHGFVGDSHIEPYSIVILIFALAYICVSLDESGLLSYIAVHVTGRWGHNGRILLLCFYALSAIMAILTNNDVVVLCLTPIICVFSDTTGVDAEPFLIAMFIAANTASMALFIGNPTNIIVAQANKISFLSYSAWMALPFLGAAVAGIVVLYFTSLRKVPGAIEIDVNIRPRDMIRKVRQAVLGSIILVSCLIALCVSSFFGVAVWIVTLPFGGAMLLIDAAIDIYTTRNVSDAVPTAVVDVDHDIGNSEIEIQMPIQSPEYKSTKISPSATIATDAPAQAETDTALAEKYMASTKNGFSRSMQRYAIHCLRTAELRLPTVTAVLGRLPYGIIPFSLGMFIIVESLSEQGWTPRLAWLLKRMCPSTAAAVFIVGAVTTLACNILNNLPMTILFSRAFQHQIFAQVDSGTQRGAMFALVIGSNLGANFTLVGSLAGLMFQNIASQKNRNIGYFRFMKWCAPVMVFQLAASCAILVAELAVID
ncbi:hypothetical protein H4R24_005133 [Coemansia sp. RSA 988]|nr:hypothetical protein H4R24_005133 [Coemansia sp. RSA 988]